MHLLERRFRENNFSIKSLKLRFRKKQKYCWVKRRKKFIELFLDNLNKFLIGYGEHYLPYLSSEIKEKTNSKNDLEEFFNKFAYNPKAIIADLQEKYSISPYEAVNIWEIKP